jgi:hypothetical protein
MRAADMVAVGTALAGGPAQIPACGITALGSYLGCVAAKRACGNGCTVRVGGIHRVAMRFILAQVSAPGRSGMVTRTLRCGVMSKLARLPAGVQAVSRCRAVLPRVSGGPWSRSKGDLRPWPSAGSCTSVYLLRRTSWR